MAELGTITVLLALALALYGSVGSIAGHLRGSQELVVSARRATYMTLPVTAAAAGALVAAFVNNDFRIKYVHDHSNLVMDRAYTWVAMYAGNEGSLLYIALVLALMSAVAIYLAPRRFSRSMPYTIAILAGVQAFYFLVLAFFASPFELLDFVPADGLGINPLLKHPGMFSHPPMLMAGLIGITIPFAFAIGALIAGNYGDDWVDLARSSAIIVWGILGVGLLLGAWWAYTILGWGGYWGWDPIENVALMPWLVLTAFIHSIMVQKRRGMFRMWNIALINIAFVLAQLGMFINRGGPVVSVHSFASSTLGLIFLSFMLLSLVFAFGVFIWRYPSLKSDRPMESFLSREASFLVNNFLLLGVAFATLWGVIYPVFSEMARDVQVSVGAPYFNRINGPMLLAVVFVMGIGPLLPWRKTSTRSLRQWLVAPALVGMSVTAGLLIAGIREPIAVLAFGVIAFVAASILEEWYRGTAARHRGGEAWPVAYWRLVNGNRPRHGGYVVHIAILVLAVGIVGTQFFDQRTDIALRQGESAVIDDYRVEYVSHETEQRSDRTAQWANLDVYRIDPAEYAADPAGWRIEPSKYVVEGNGYPGDRRLETLQPWHGFYTEFQQVSVRAGIRSTPVEDLYVIPSDFLADGRVLLRISINPLAWWLWFAGPIFVIGAMVALWPQPAVERRFATSRTSHPVAAQRTGPSHA
ncbi:MAG: cytochrome c-type biogenesis CcmF C-terminal domain-containing protein [Dehalococcoidia bacterium]